MSDTPSQYSVHTEPFVLHLEFEWDGGTFAEFETNFHQFSWDIPKLVYFSEPMSGFGAHLAMNAFETSIKDRSGDLVHVLAGGIVDLHHSGAIELGAHAQADIRVLNLQQTRFYLGIQGQVLADPHAGTAEVTFAPTLSIQFDGFGH